MTIEETTIAEPPSICNLKEDFFENASKKCLPINPPKRKGNIPELTKGITQPEPCKINIAEIIDIPMYLFFIM